MISKRSLVISFILIVGALILLYFSKTPPELSVSSSYTLAAQTELQGPSSV